MSLGASILLLLLQCRKCFVQQCLGKPGEMYLPKVLEDAPVVSVGMQASWCKLEVDVGSHKQVLSTAPGLQDRMPPTLLVTALNLKTYLNPQVSNAAPASQVPKSAWLASYLASASAP